MPVKAVRIVQLLLIVLAAVYLWLFHSANPGYVQLPWPLNLVFAQQPVGFVVIAAVIVGWLIGWIPPRILLLRRNRQVRRLQNELAEERRRTAPYEATPDPYYTQSGIPDRSYEREMPVIPDRAYDPEADDPDEAA
ncbi:MAG TPA: LapA family protein [Trueperaceae bacterium]